MIETFDVIRIFFGVMLTVLSADSLFFHKIKHKGSERGGALMKAFYESGYLGTFIQITELVVGLMLITGLFVPLALVILAPVSINILLFHLYLDRRGTGIAVAVVVLNIYLAWAYAASYAPLLHR